MIEDNEAYYREQLAENKETRALLAERDVALKAARSDLEKQLLEQIAEKEKQILYTQARLDDLTRENEQLKENLKEERNRIRKKGAGDDGAEELVETPSMVIEAEVMEEEVQKEVSLDEKRSDSKRPHTHLTNTTSSPRRPLALLKRSCTGFMASWRGRAG